MLMSLAQAHALVPGSVRVGDPDTPLQRVHTDTRSLRAGDLFVALSGEHYDGNDFLAQARQSGAVAALAQRGLAGTPTAGPNPTTMPGLCVADTLVALQQLASGWRARFHLPLVAVVGSNGKTTVTQMLASILRAWCGDAALATAGNLNNHIGVPLTLLRLRQDDEVWHRAAVLELGTNHVGEIVQLARLCAPTVALINNAQREHQEFLHGLDAVAQENGSVIDALGPAGTVVLPAADVYAASWRAHAGARRVLSFALAGAGHELAADVSGSAVWQPGSETASISAPGSAPGSEPDSEPDSAPGSTPDSTPDLSPGSAPGSAPGTASAHWQLQLATPLGRITTSLHQPGRHNLHNALAAATAALAAGAPLTAIAQGLANFVPVAGRSQVLSLWRGARQVTLIDDSYNANPDSVLAAIDVLADLPGPRWLVLGDMAEVGSQGPQFHAEVGAHAKTRGIESVWSAGALCAQLGVGRHFSTVAEMLAALGESPQAASVLVKGSRFMKMEQVVKALQAAPTPNTSTTASTASTASTAPTAPTAPTWPNPSTASMPPRTGAHDAA